MKISNSLEVSQLIKKGRKAQNISQSDAAVMLGISRTKLAMMEVSNDALDSASFLSVLKSIKLAGLELHIVDPAQLSSLIDVARNDEFVGDHITSDYQFDDGWA